MIKENQDWQIVKAQKPDWANFITRDSHGLYQYHEKEPKLEGMFNENWHSEGKMDCFFELEPECIKIKTISPKEALENWHKNRDKSITPEEWNEMVEELNNQRYRPYLNDNAKNTVRNSLSVIYNHCEVVNDNNEQVDLAKMRLHINRILEALELGKTLGD